MPLPVRVSRSIAMLLGMAALGGALWVVLPGEQGALERQFCVVLAIGGALAFDALGGRPGFGGYVMALVLLVVQSVSRTKLQLLHAPLLAPDVRYGLSPDTVAVLLKYPLVSKRALAAVALVGAFGVTIWRLAGPGLWLGAGAPLRRRLLRVGSVVAVLVATGLLLGRDGPFAPLHAASAWEFLEGSTNNPAYSFFASFLRMDVAPPAYRSRPDRAEDWSATPIAQTPPGARPDILVVLEESTFPPRLLSDCTQAFCDLPMFTPDAHTLASGGLEVHTFGGLTWTTEFALLTGLPHSIFGSAGIYAPYNLAPRMRVSLARRLRELGYHTVVLYPVFGSFGNARRAYADYGFERFHDAAEIDLKWESTDLYLEQAFERLYAEERRLAGDKPIFFFVLTMRQHGPHDEPYEKLEAPFDHPQFASLDAATNLGLSNYLSRLHQSDRAVGAFERVVLAQSRPALMLHFGDHQPSLGGAMLNLPKRAPAELGDEARNLTYFMLKGNRPHEARTEYSLLDIAFLGGVLLERAGLPPGDYFGANQRLRERCGRRFIHCADADALEAYYAHVFDDLDVFTR